MRALNRREELLRQARRQPEVEVDQLLAVEQPVQDLLAKVRQTHPRRQPDQGRTRQSKAANLRDRLEDYDLSVLSSCSIPTCPSPTTKASRTSA